MLWFSSNSCLFFFFCLASYIKYMPRNMERHVFIQLHDFVLLMCIDFKFIWTWLISVDLLEIMKKKQLSNTERFLSPANMKLNEWVIFCNSKMRFIIYTSFLQNETSKKRSNIPHHIWFIRLVLCLFHFLFISISKKPIIFVCVCSACDTIPIKSLSLFSSISSSLCPLETFVHVLQAPIQL